MFCSQWFLTLFSYRYSLPLVELTYSNAGHSFPLEIVFRIFDNCLANGIEAIFGFALSLLQKNEAKLLSLKFDELVAFLNTGIIDTYKVRAMIYNRLPPFYDGGSRMAWKRM
jgi:ecotropic viral integration site 5 protein